MTQTLATEGPTQASPRRLSAVVARSSIWIVLLVVILILPQIFNSRFSLSLMSQMGISIIFALSYNLLLGQTGLLSFGQAALLGLGGFTAIHLMKAIDDGLGLPVGLLPLVGALAGGTAGVLLGWLATRRAGTAFAMITLGLGEMIAASSFLLVGFFGGEQGISADRTGGAAILGFDLGPQVEVYYLIAAWMLIAAGLMYGLSRTPLGRIAMAVADNPERVSFLCFDVPTIRWLMFIASGIFAGVAGGLQAINYEIMTTSAMNAAASGAVLIMVYIGGKDSFLGPVLGAILVTFLQFGLGSFTSAWILYMGIIFMAMVLFAPGGMAGLIEMHMPILTAGLAWGLVPIYAMLVLPSAALVFSTTLLIEISYHLAFDKQSGPVMNLFGLTIDTTSHLMWFAGVGLLLVGILSLTFVRAAVYGRWSSLLARAHERSLS